MIALFLKDLFALRKSLLFYFGFVLIWSLLGLFSDEFSFFQVFVLLLATMMPMSAFSLDEQTKWEQYVRCMPVRPVSAVLSRYLLVILAVVVAALPPLVLFGIKSAVLGSWDSYATLAVSLFLLASLGLFLAAFQLPFLFFLGAHRGRFAAIALIVLVSCGIPLLVTQLSPSDSEAILATELASKLILFSPLICLAAFLLSIPLSILGFQKKKF